MIFSQTLSVLACATLMSLIAFLGIRLLQMGVLSVPLIRQQRGTLLWNFFEVVFLLVLLFGSLIFLVGLEVALGYNIYNVLTTGESVLTFN